MRNKHKTSNVKKHRGNPHGNAPNQTINQRKGTEEDNLHATIEPGVSKSSRMKQ